MKPKHVLALTIAVLMSACGPGVGGTGRPAESREFVNLAGAQSVPVCSAPWAGLLSCQPPVTGNAVAANHPGTSKVQYGSSGGPNPEFVLSFEGNKLSLEGGCPRISFDGEWAQIGSETALFFGGYLSANLIQPALATATVKALPPTSSDGQPGIQLEVRSASGQLLTLLQMKKLSDNQTGPRNCP